jgi:hypothetical protein
MIIHERSGFQLQIILLFHLQEVFLVRKIDIIREVGDLGNLCELIIHVQLMDMVLR